MRWTNKESEVNSMQGKTPFSSIECLWRPSSLVSISYQRFILRSKAAGASSWQHTWISCKVQQYIELYILTAKTSSCGA